MVVMFKVKSRTIFEKEKGMENLANLLVPFLVVVLGSVAAAAAESGNEKVLTDEQRMEQVRGYFESPYQDEDYFRTDRLLLTATGSLKPVHRSPSVATVITAEDIEKMGARSLNDVLETVPGLHVTASDKNAMDTAFSIRGIQTSLNPHVLLLQNGSPLTFTFTGSRLTSLYLPIANISRVEVVRGPGSAVHGADAFAGTINIITKEGREINGTNGGLRYGSFNTIDGWLQHGGEYSGWDMALNLEFSRSDGDEDRIIDSDMQSLLDLPPPAGFGSSASLAPGPLRSEYEILNTNLAFARKNWTARFWYWQNNDIGLRDGVVQLLSDKSSADAEQFLAELIYSDDKLFRNVEMDVHLSFMYEHIDAYMQLFPAGALLPVDADGSYPEGNIEIPPDGDSKFVLFTDGVFGEPIETDYQYYAGATFLHTGFANQQLRLATGIRHIEGEYGELKNFGPGVIDSTLLLSPPGINFIDGTLTDVTGTKNVFCEDQSRTLWFLSLQDEWSFSRGWELTAGVRYDHYSDFGETVNPRVALVWETTPALTSKLLYGEAFRPPSIAELYNKNNPSNQGNSTLDPETIRTLELAFDFQPIAHFRSIFSVFAYDMEDLIELVPTGGEVVAQNARDQEGYGFELEAFWQMFSTFQLKGNVAYQNSEDKETGFTVPDAPQLQAYLNTHWNFQPEWFFDAQCFWIGKRERAAGDVRPEIDDYSLVNLSLRRKKISKYIDMALIVKNLLDEDVREPSKSFILNDYPMEGRSVWGEIRFYF